ncbi:hypothetical protein AV530_004347 [Patagioenas fasciata monilis]|uniref:Uncharacterized protein n=1 Tax=Patagioenas fasciata monilis TaxID=372326 RepID=A0A1V4K939_PATFA|nr:hypothetical protein AV530_004347 [Patagioenas fasciata monilis]
MEQQSRQQEKHKEVQNETSPVPRYGRREHFPHGIALAFSLFMMKEYSKDKRKANHHNSNVELLPCKQCEIQRICGAEPPLRPSEDPPATTIQSCGSLPVFALCLPTKSTLYVHEQNVEGIGHQKHIHHIYPRLKGGESCSQPGAVIQPTQKISSHFSASNPTEKE